MGFVSDWLDSARELIESPSGFFEGEDRRDGFGYPLKFAAFSFLVSGVLSALRIVVYGTSMESSLSMPVAAGVTLVSSVVGGIIGMVIGAGLIHIFVALLGGENGYSDTLAVMGYTSAISAVASVLNLVPLIGPLVSLLLAFYSIYVQAKGLEIFQELSFGRSLVAILLPVVIITVVVVLLMVTVFASMLALSGMPA